MDAWAALRAGKRVDHQVRRADQPVLHRARRLERQPFLHQRRIDTTAELGEHFWPHNMRLGAIHLDLADPTGLHHREVGPQPATDLLIGAGSRLFQEFQRPSHPGRDGRTSPRGKSGKAPGARAVHGRHQGRPRKRVSPLANGRRCGNKVCDLEARSTAGQPMLAGSSERHDRLS